MKSITTLFFTFFLLTSLFSQAPCGGINQLVIPVHKPLQSVIWMGIVGILHLPIPLIHGLNPVVF